MRHSPRTRALKLGIVSEADVESLPEPLKKIVMAFQMVPDPMARYKQLLFYAAKLKTLPEEYQTSDNKVPGCVSQVWVVPTLEDGKVYFRAESDSQLTKGLAALLVEGLSGCTPQEVLSVKPDFIEMLGLSQSLTPSRSNGFLNMLLTMQKKTIAAFMEQEKASKSAKPAPAASEGEPALKPGEGGVKQSMSRKLGEAFTPAKLVINDDSDQHAGHGGSKGLRSGETHFSVEIVSEAFQGMNRVKRQRAVYAVLDEEIKGGVHALSLVTKTPEEASD